MFPFFRTIRGEKEREGREEEKTESLKRSNAEKSFLLFSLMEVPYDDTLSTYSKGMNVMF